MFTGTPQELRRREQEAAQYAEKIAELLQSVDALGIGSAVGRIDGPGFSLVHDGRRWQVRT